MKSVPASRTFIRIIHTLVILLIFLKKDLSTCEQNVPFRIRALSVNVLRSFARLKEDRFGSMVRFGFHSDRNLYARRIHFRVILDTILLPLYFACFLSLFVFFISSLALIFVITWIVIAVGSDCKIFFPYLFLRNWNIQKQRISRHISAKRMWICYSRIIMESN